MSALLDPVHSLAFSMHANKGVYAVLVGSGISRSAGIPTGWEVTLDLVKRLAAVCGEACDPSPEQWYSTKYGKAPDYSDLLDALAKTPAERQQLLRSYWEPTDEEREQGAKQPSLAHRAIAALAAKGYVRVILTTNFDRLMESALADVGVVPTVLSSPDHVHGALPLIHTRCCVFKIHGDYLDTRIRNTPQELAAYPQDFDRLLDRIIDEFGLVVCGWSAEWDPALRAALLRAPSRRFAVYWAARDEPADAARQIVSQRGATLIPIKDADTFFGSLQRHVEALEEFSRPHPLSTEAAVASLKRYLSEPKYRIQLADLIDEEARRVADATTGASFAANVAFTAESATARVRAYDAACSTLLAMGVVGGSWVEDVHVIHWQRALQCVATVGERGGLDVWLGLRRYPGTLLLYALTIGAVAAGRIQSLAALFATTIYREGRDDIPAVQVLPPFCLFDGGAGGETARFLPGMEHRHAPLNDWLHAVLRDATKRVIPDDAKHTFVFDKAEILIALGFSYLAKRAKGWYWAPPGAYGYRSGSTDQILAEIRASLAKLGEGSPYVHSQIFGTTVNECTEALDAFDKFRLEELRRWRF